MMDLKPVQQLLETEMDRKEFLSYLGASLLAVIGISGLIKSIASSLEPTTSKSTTKAGYGGDTYGG